METYWSFEEKSKYEPTDYLPLERFYEAQGYSSDDPEARERGLLSVIIPDENARVRFMNETNFPQTAAHRRISLIEGMAVVLHRSGRLDLEVRVSQPSTRSLRK